MYVANTEEVVEGQDCCICPCYCYCICVDPILTQSIFEVVHINVAVHNYEVIRSE